MPLFSRLGMRVILDWPALSSSLGSKPRQETSGCRVTGRFIRRKAQRLQGWREPACTQERRWSCESVDVWSWFAPFWFSENENNDFGTVAAKIVPRDDHNEFSAVDRSQVRRYSLFGPLSDSHWYISTIKLFERRLKGGIGLRRRLQSCATPD